jgi:hypothetical protein
MRPFVAIFIAVVAMGAGPAALAAEAAPPAKPVFGYLDPKTDIFTPSPQPSSPTPAVVPINRKGTLVVTGTVAIDPSVPPTASFFVSVSATATDVTYATSVSRSAPMVRTGNSGKVVLKLPYVFTVTSPSDVVTINFQMSSSTGEIVSLTETIPLPANGATTAVAIGQRA